MNAKLVSWNLVVAALAAPWPLPAQLPPPTHAPIVGARMPSLSPDGKRLAFAYRGDIWIAEADGGRAAPLTQHVETDAYPLFSPDGQWVAFSSKRTGNWDVFVVPAEGGPARQLTFHSGTDVATGWRADGRYLLFSSKRDAPNYSLYALNVQSLRTRLLADDYAPMMYANYAPDGQTVVYGRYGFPWTRPRYVGSAAAQICLLQVGSGARRLVTDDQRQHLWTRFMPDSEHLLTVTVSETTPSSGKLGEVLPPLEDNCQRTPNLWLFNTQGLGEQITRFVGGSVRWPAVASETGDIAFEQGLDLWLLRHGEKEPRKLRLFVAVDEKQTSRRRERATTGVSEAEPSPDGKTFAFGLSGDIWTVAIDKPKGVAGRNAGFARRLTDWAGDDSDFSWSADGKKVYFTSDRELYTRLYELDLATLRVKPLWNTDRDVTRVMLSPDGKELSFWASGQKGGLYVLTLATGRARRVVNAPGPQWHGQGGGDYAWSPDQRWLAYALRDASRAWNIWVVPAAGGEPRNLTRLYARHSLPAWSPDGRFLFFQSNRDGEGLYVLPLTKESVRAIDTDLKFEKSTNVVEVQIDFDAVNRRIRKHASQSPQADLTVTADGQIVFISDGDIWSVSYDGKESKRLTSGGGKAGLRVAKDGRKAHYILNGELYTMKLDDKKEEKVGFTAEWQRDIKAERQAAFTQFWRSIDRGFYDSSFHGRNWSKIRETYQPLLEAVETGDDFATLLNMMVGELESSHAEVSASGGPVSPVTPHLGFTFDCNYSGPGLKVAKVPTGSPGSYVNTLIRRGEIVLKINDHDVAANEKLYDLINDKQDREFEFLVSTNGARSGARWVKYKVLTQEEWADLNYRNRIEFLRRRVEEKSRDRIGYLHIASMQQPNQAQFEREVYQYIAGRDALIIDVRFNNGGNIADTLIDWLERKPHGYTRPRDGEPEPSPYHAIDRKMVVLMNEHSYSNAEIFPYAMRARGLARLVGTATPGYVIWTNGLKLADGTGARLPMTGAYRLDGTCMENHGLEPDVLVKLSPEDWLSERDPQLDRAIEMLLPDPPIQ